MGWGKLNVQQRISSYHIYAVTKPTTMYTHYSLYDNIIQVHVYGPQENTRGIKKKKPSLLQYYYLIRVGLDERTFSIRYIYVSTSKLNRKCF